jgi:hypothetical protein
MMQETGFPLAVMLKGRTSILDNQDITACPAW